MGVEGENLRLEEVNGPIEGLHKVINNLFYGFGFLGNRNAHEHGIFHKFTVGYGQVGFMDIKALEAMGINFFFETST